MLFYIITKVQSNTRFFMPIRVVPSSSRYTHNNIIFELVPIIYIEEKKHQHLQQEQQQLSWLNAFQKLKKSLKQIGSFCIFMKIVHSWYVKASNYSKNHQAKDLRWVALQHSSILYSIRFCFLPKIIINLDIF